MHILLAREHSFTFAMDGYNLSVATWRGNKTISKFIPRNQFQKFVKNFLSFDRKMSRSKSMLISGLTLTSMISAHWPQFTGNWLTTKLESKEIQCFVTPLEQSLKASLDVGKPPKYMTKDKYLCAEKIIKISDLLEKK